MLYGQFTHAIGLNEICDCLRHHCGWLSRIRGATLPSRNGFSCASKVCDAAMAEKPFWGVLKHLRVVQPRFGTVGNRKRLPRKWDSKEDTAKSG